VSGCAHHRTKGRDYSGPLPDDVLKSDVSGPAWKQTSIAAKVSNVLADGSPKKAGGSSRRLASRSAPELKPFVLARRASGRRMELKGCSFLVVIPSGSLE
jgi:hypothetical protein